MHINIKHDYYAALIFQKILKYSKLGDLTQKFTYEISSDVIIQTYNKLNNP